MKKINVRKTTFISILIITIISSNIEITSYINNDIPAYKIQEGIDNLVLDFITNGSIISNNNGTMGTLNLLNNGSNLIHNITIDFSNNGNFSYFTNSYDIHQEISSLSPSFSDSKNIEVALNTTDENLHTGFADVCIILDASGSMIDEIVAFKNDIQSRINNLLRGNPSLRIGIIVYGWDEYSEYPYSNLNNYFEINDDFIGLANFVDNLYASGGYEPWGDALYLANTWDWREDVNKLIVLVGDEDCDPGDYIGINSNEDFYNGSELLNIVHSLKDKGIQINTILANGYDSNTENQFRWISKITNGITIDLTKITSDQEYLQLPIIIDGWIEGLINEFNVEINANVSWKENTITGLESYNKQIKVKICVDNSSPRIVFDGFLDTKENGTYTYKIIFSITDSSTINNKSLFTTPDDLSLVSNPTWTLQNYSILKDGRRMYFEIKNLSLGDKISYYIYSSDIYGNKIYTAIQNITIIITYLAPGYTTNLFFVDDNTTQSIFLDMENLNKGYLWIEKEQKIQISPLYDSNFSYILVYESNSIVIYEIEAYSSNKQFYLTFRGNWTGIHNKIRWADVVNISLGDFFSNINSNRQNILLCATLHNFETGQLSLNTPDGNIYPWIYVFNETWSYINTFSNSSSLEVMQGKYYIWVLYNQTSGDFAISYKEILETSTIPSYNSFQNIAPFVGIFLTILLMFGIFLSKQKMKYL